MLHGYDYALFADDDLLPGNRAIEYLIETAAILKDRFSTLGVYGRVFVDNPRHRYQARNTPKRGASPVQTDITCRVNFTKVESIVAIVAFRQRLLTMNPPIASALVDTHDDMLLCLGTQLQTDDPSYVMPLETEPEQKLIKEDLPDGIGVWQRPSHFAERNQFVEMAIAAGWESLCRLEGS
jgi:hypothetical protein